MRKRALRRRWVAACAWVTASAFVSVAWANKPSPAASGSFPARLLPADKPIAEVVDYYVDAKLAAAKVTPAEQIDDANLIRRLTLDLVGRVPTPVEVRDFVASKASNKREQLVDRLIRSPEFAEHQANEFDWMLMQGQGSVRSYLTTAFRENRSWDRMFRDFVLADGEGPDKAAAEFLKPRLRDQDRLTNDVSSLFFGVNISCAQCHDHPLAKDWKQDHFYGLKSFFARTYENGGFIGEREYGLVSYQTPKGEQRQAKLMFLTGRMVDEPKRDEPDNKAKKAEQEELKKLAEKKQPPPKPSFSRRAVLVKTSLESDQRHFFARSIVNRLWARLLGYGLVMPIDQMHSANPASHPELLDWLARDVADHGFDLPRLVRVLVLSKTYSRSSRWERGDRPLNELFAVAQVRPLSPYQYAASLRVATADPETWTKLKTIDEVMQRAAGLAASARGLANPFAPPAVDFQVAVSESLYLANDAKVQSELLSDGSDRLVGRLKQIAEPEKQADCVVETVLGRKADAEERRLIVAYLRERSDRPVEAARQVVWSLLTGSEFRFNY